MSRDNPPNFLPRVVSEGTVLEKLELLRTLKINLGEFQKKLRDPSISDRERGVIGAYWANKKIYFRFGAINKLRVSLSRLSWFNFSI